ncbi:MAG: site-specific integrase [Sciscionella sp.]
MSKRSDGGGTGPLAAHAAGFDVELARWGYSTSAANRHIQLMAQLDRWLVREGLDVAVLATERVESFFGARREAGYVTMRTSRSVAPLVGYLRGVGVLTEPRPRVVAGPVETLLRAFRGYLLGERGLVEGTVACYVRVARLFLSERAGPDGLNLGGLVAGDVVEFAAQECEHLGLSASRVVVSALRSLLRYLRGQGLTVVALDQAVLSVAGWSPQLPKTVPPGQVRRLVDSCDRGTAIGCRDYAVVLLLARLGLRVGEVVVLELGDIDWRAGEIVVHGKGNRRDRLPLPTDLGEALAAYLRRGRPASDSRRVFLRHYAPCRGFEAGSGVIRGVLARACEQANLPYVSPHRLRHSLASDMLRHGGSLAEIGEVLRHQSAAATAVYAKVDLVQLRALAQPWPAGAA